MIIVHHLEHSRSQRILWILEELEANYSLEIYRRDPKTRLAPKRLRDIHPLGKAPVIEDDGHVFAESGAILEYLVETYGPDLKPSSTEALNQYRYWLHYAEGSAMSPLLLHVIFSEMPRQSPWIAKPVMKAVSLSVDLMYIRPQIKLHADFWESHLANHTWFAGDDFSAADVAMSFPLEALASIGEDEDRPAIKGFLERIHERPAYKRALERGGPFNL